MREISPATQRAVRLILDSTDIITVVAKMTDEELIRRTYIGTRYDVSADESPVWAKVSDVEFTDADGNEYLPFDDGYSVEFTHNGKRCAPESGFYSGKTEIDAKKHALRQMSIAYGSPVVITSVRKALATRICEANHCGKLRDYLFCARCGLQAKCRDVGTIAWSQWHGRCDGRRPNIGDENL